MRDPVSKAADVLRLSPLPVVPVVDADRTVGMVGMHELSLSNGVSTATPVGRVMRPPPPPLPAGMPAADGLAIMESLGVAFAPVVAGHGRLAGMVSRADLYALASGNLRPVRCGGMATPLGVYLTTGLVRAGAGDLGLFLAGSAMGALALLSLALVFVLVWLVDERWNIGLMAAFGIVAPGGAHAPLLRAAVTLVWIAVYAVLFRSSPLAGYHAAEHMTVNAIEQGDVLTARAVRGHSRVHVRCGTNLVVVMFAFALIGQVIALPGVWLGIFALVVVLNRTVVGGVAQQYVTTRPPTERELASGVAAGQALIDAHQRVIGRPITLWQRIWCMGIIQAAAGLFAAYELLALSLSLLHANTIVDFLG